MPTPNASQWNIGDLGLLALGLVHFMLFVSISFALGHKMQTRFQWNMGFNVTSKSVFPLQIMTKINNLSFYHDLNLSKM